MWDKEGNNENIGGQFEALLSEPDFVVLVFHHSTRILLSHPIIFGISNGRDPFLRQGVSFLLRYD